MTILIDDIDEIIYFGSSSNLDNRYKIKYENFNPDLILR